MAKTGIPFSIDALTPAWLSRSLSEAGLPAEVRVESIKQEPVAGGSGLFGTVMQLKPEYNSPTVDAPETMIVKIPVADENSRGIGLALRLYEREILFYRHLAEHLPIATPTCISAQMALQEHSFVLLLEDLSARRLGDQLAGWTEDEADIAVDQLARLHAACWGESGLQGQDWLPVSNDPALLGLIHGAYQQSWQAFVAHFGERLPGPIRAAGESLCESLPALADRLAEPPRTLVHGDYRMDNMIFGRNAAEAPLTIIDWQLVARARGAFDIAYFLVQGSQPTRRNASEMRILRRYHDLLLAEGVKGYDFERLKLDYRASVLYGLVYIVISVGSLAAADDRMRQLFAAALERATTAIMDLNATELLPS